MVRSGHRAVVHDSVIGKFAVAKFLIVTTSGRS